MKGKLTNPNLQKQILSLTDCKNSGTKHHLYFSLFHCNVPFDQLS